MSEFSDNSFTQADVEGAHLAFSLWQGTQHETVDEYVMRKRKIELNCLVNEVIENELTDAEKALVRMHWYEERSHYDISKALGVSPSTITRKFEKINNIIYDKLKYAIQYRYGKDYSRAVKVIIKNKDGLCLFSAQSTSPAQRIRELRIRQGLSLNDTEAMTGIGVGKLERIEKGEQDILVKDVSRIATAFRVSCDYIISGKM